MLRCPCSAASAPIDPLLGPLADNGGPTLTIALLSGSPAIDAGVSVLDVTTDQRGVPLDRRDTPRTSVHSQSPYSQAATVLNLQRYGVHLHPTTLVVTFSLPMDQASAQALTNYLLVSAGPDVAIVFGMKDDHAIWMFLLLHQDAVTQTVTLLPIHRLLLRGIFRLTIKGTSPSGLKSVSDLFLDGSGQGPRHELRRPHHRQAPRSTDTALGRRACPERASAEDLIWGETLRRPQPRWASRPSYRMKVMPSLAGSLQQEQPCGAEAADLCEHLLRLLLRLRRVNVPGLHCDLPVISMLHRCEPARPGVIMWCC